jgi:hypothetical protein
MCWIPRDRRSTRESLSSLLAALAPRFTRPSKLFGSLGPFVVRSSRMVENCRGQLWIIKRAVRKGKKSCRRCRSEVRRSWRRGWARGPLGAVDQRG